MGFTVMVSNCVSQTQNASQPKPTTRYYECQCTCHDKQSSITDTHKKLHNQDLKMILALFVEMVLTSLSPVTHHTESFTTKI